MGSTRRFHFKYFLTILTSCWDTVGERFCIILLYFLERPQKRPQSSEIFPGLGVAAQRCSSPPPPSDSLPPIDPCGELSQTNLRLYGRARAFWNIYIYIYICRFCFAMNHRVTFKARPIINIRKVRATVQQGFFCKAKHRSTHSRLNACSEVALPPRLLGFCT